MPQGETRIYQVCNLDPDDRITFASCRPLMIDRIKPVRPVLTKQDFYRRFHTGEFGNHGPMWETLDAWRDSGYPGKIAIRTRVRAGRCDFNVARHEVPSRYLDFLRTGWRDEQLHYSAMCPHDCLTCQGELRFGDYGLEGFISTALHLPMRPALAHDGRHMCGLELHNLLRRSMNRDDYEHLLDLLDRYDGHVVEFSAFTKPWGVVRGSRCVVWELRRY